MDDSSSTDTFLVLLTGMVWIVVAVAAVLTIVWKLQKKRRRRLRREAAREAQRKLDEWRNPAAPDSKL